MKFFRPLTVRKVEIVIACLFLLLALLLGEESVRVGTGWGSAGPQPGFFPLLMCILVAFGALGVLGQVIRDNVTSPFFEERQEIIDLMKVGIPMVLAIALVPYLGLYLISLIYTVFFGYWYGRVRWYVVLLVGLALTYGIWTLEWTFHIAMPKSFWYPTIPF